MGIWEDRAMAEARVKNNILFASLICCSIALAGCQTTENLRTAQTPPDISADNPLTVMSFNIRQHHVVRMGLSKTGRCDLHELGVAA